MRKLLSLILLLTLIACQSESRNSRNGLDRKIELITPGGESIETTLAIDPKEQEKGLSGTKPEDFDEDEGMLFFYVGEDERHFWMPDTYFDLDLFYLDKDLKIIDIIRKLPHYIGRASPELIPRARGVWSRHVLEMKSSSAISQRLKIGDILKWKDETSLKETEELVQKELMKP